MENKIIKAYNKGYRCTKSGIPLGIDGKEIKGWYRNDGYHFIKVRINSTENLNISIHRLQAFQKYGHKLFEQGIEVRHLDGNPKNNSWGNILIGNHSENIMDIPEEIRIAKALHATSFTRKYDKQEIRDFHKKENSYKKTMEKFNISSKGTLHHILKSDIIST